jgi:hypothetical protein
VSLPAANLQNLKDASDILTNVATAGAIVVGAAWAYWRFLRERTRWPRAALALEFTERRLNDSTVLLAVKLRLTNQGRGLMKLTDLRFDLYRVRPLNRDMRGKIDRSQQYNQSGLETAWPLIDQHTRSWQKKERPELEPGESDEFSADFFLDPSEQTVFLYTYLENVKKKRRFRRRKLGWPATAFLDLDQARSRRRLASLLPGGDS